MGIFPDTPQGPSPASPTHAFGEWTGTSGVVRDDDEPTLVGPSSWRQRPVHATQANELHDETSRLADVVVTVITPLTLVPGTGAFPPEKKLSK